MPEIPLAADTTNVSKVPLIPEGLDLPFRAIDSVHTALKAMANLSLSLAILSLSTGLVSRALTVLMQWTKKA
jgi:hypothetical protein